MKIESILCPIDLSPDSDEALRYAIALSRAYSAELILLHCDLNDPRLAAVPAAMDVAGESIRESLQKYAGSADRLDSTGKVSSSPATTWGRPSHAKPQGTPST